MVPRRIINLSGNASVIYEAIGLADVLAFQVVPSHDHNRFVQWKGTYVVLFLGDLTDQLRTSCFGSNISWDTNEKLLDKV